MITFPDNYGLINYTLYLDNWSSQSTWFHYMGIVVPDELVVADLSFMFIGLGNNDDGQVLLIRCTIEK